MAASKGLTAIEVTRQRKPGRYADGGGLYLQVTQAGTKSWLLRFMLDGRSREMGLGSTDIVSLAEAREAARAGRRLLLGGTDPIELRRREKLQARAASAKLMTFRECAEKYIVAHQAGWKSEKHAGQWRSTLVTYAYPTIGDLAVDAVDAGLVLRILEQPESDKPHARSFWASKTETASRVRGRIESVLDWAKARGMRGDGENPARWRGHLDQLLPAKSSVSPVEHHKALPYTDLPTFMASLRAKNSVSARALEFTILTAARTSDTIESVNAEINFDDQLWTIPKGRMKGKKGARKYDHVVPLSDRALEIARASSDGDGFIFPGADSGDPLSNMAMLELLQGMVGCEDLTVHGFRSTFKDWCAEMTSFPNELSEMALAHTVPDKVERAYRRGDMRQKRRRLMDDWARYCSGRKMPSQVVPIRAAAT